MILNYIWIGFLLIAFIVACFQAFLFGNTQIFSDIMNATFESAKTGFEISLGLTGVLALWLGIMKIGENGGIIKAFSRLVGPFFSKIFPDIPKDHPAMGSIFMNISANMLGLDNAATPMGLKAMKELQEINPHKDRASNPMIMFLVLNSSGLTIIPITIMVYRAQLGAANPTDVFLPILLATFFSTLVGFLSVAIMQKINLFDKTILLTLLGFIAVVAGLIFFLMRLPKDQLAIYSNLAAAFILFSIIISFIVLAAFRKVNVYESFIEGAKDGFQVAIGIIPYLIAILLAIGVFRASGAMDFIIDGIGKFVAMLGLDTEFVHALPTALMKPLSGSGARGMMIDAMTQHGADSFVGRLVCIVQGSTETTFYILAVYYGSVGIKKTRYTLGCSLLADLAGIIAAILIGYLFFF
ncbi:MAG TPA: nucleoside recognition domain-containing protein [Bacteroidales bacterium]|nr:nucleoside recognition domain-containing protein [Paludibacter sp.]HOS17008.1 nucleoside recognition domain-containing protein [Bacteroidales bacterium]HPM09385.1 nucleoside recognition domain-containing protein [Paludibacter sp.]